MVVSAFRMMFSLREEAREFLCAVSFGFFLGVSVLSGREKADTRLFACFCSSLSPCELSILRASDPNKKCSEFLYQIVDILAVVNSALLYWHV